MSVLVFNKWSTEGIKVDDMGLQRYITLDPRFVPKTGARYAGKKFYKSRTFIVERLINKVMIPGHKAKKHFRSSGHMTGKSNLSYNIVMGAFNIIEQKTKQNPVAVFVKALENAAPREEIVTIEYGGARYPKATDCAPQRRVDVALRYFVQGAYDRCFNKKTSVQEALADEILCAFKLDPKSLAISKKGEIERQADSSR
ncbi:MAG: 30S ribosomal protein S7 [Candidatus Woesearchaeota archaeon]